MIAIIYINRTISDFHSFFRQADYAFDEKFPLIFRIAEDHDVSPLRRVETIGYFVYYQIFTIKKTGLHRGAHDVERLEEEISYRQDHHQRDNDHLEGFRDEF